ncbi:MAG: efflux RND transporter periplasmic adaptor subunit [Chloroflexi bacterium]|nr:efflux RND transporter periplasmic adaptor subunit [Chloroflexota bacterium]
MNHKRPPVPAIVVLLIVIAASAYFIYSQSATDKNGALTASGFIEATQVNIAPELAGKVTEVLVAEGDSVHAGDPLLRLDASLLTAQRAVASAAVDTARAAVATAESTLAAAQVQYDLALRSSVMQDKALRTADWYRSAPGEFTLPLWYYSKEEQIQAAMSEVNAAKEFLTAAEERLKEALAKEQSADFIKAESALAEAQATFEVAEDLFTRIKSGNTLDDLTQAQQAKLSRGYYIEGGVDQDLYDAANAFYDDAKSQLDAAQDAYETAATTDGAKAVLKVRAEVSIAKERYFTSLDNVLARQTGEAALTVIAAQKALEQVTSAVEQSKAAVAQAEANLSLLDTQLSKLTITAPSDGVVLTRNVEVGEFVQPGATALVIGQLSDLTITVYVPEDKYGALKLGQSATVTVDSHPGVTFIATIVNISDKAEFTPRNVQTVEGRSSTVYAIKLSVTDPDGKLKIGMPADVVFE